VLAPRLLARKRWSSFPGMSAEDSSSKFNRPAYAGLDFIKAAFCPLEFNAMRFAEHPKYVELAGDQGLDDLEVSDPLDYPRRFPYTDENGHRQMGSQMVNALFGLAPADFDLFLGLFTYLKRLPELPADGCTYLTLDFIARQCGLPATCQKDYHRLRSRIFRLSYVKYTNSAFWNAEERQYDIVNFGFFNLRSLSRLSESRRPVTMEWDRSVLRLLTGAKFLAFDYELYRSLSPALRRLYLIANRDGWNQRDSSVFIADDFAIHQIGYSDRPEFQKQRLQKLRRLVQEAEDRDLIRPYIPWNGYFQTINHGPHKGRLAIRWSRGPALRTKPADAERITEDQLENDALFAQLRELRDEDRKTMTPLLYRRLVAQYGRERMQKHTLVILAQKESRPGTFQRSEIAAFIDRLKNDHPEPDWFQILKRAERLSLFEEVQPNQLSMDIYGAFFRD